MKKKTPLWILDAVIVVIVFIGFEVIDYNLASLQSAPFYYDFLLTAKWLLIGGFTFHGAINYWINRSR